MPLTHEERQKLREAATAAARAIVRPYARLRPGSWELQTSNSFRRIGMDGDGNVLCAVTQRSDNHPDLHAPPGVLDYIIAAQPSVVLNLLDQLDAAEQLTSQLGVVEVRLSRVQGIITALAEVMAHLPATAIKDPSPEIVGALNSLARLLDEAQKGDAR